MPASEVNFIPQPDFSSLPCSVAVLVTCVQQHEHVQVGVVSSRCHLHALLECSRRAA